MSELVKTYFGYFRIYTTGYIIGVGQGGDLSLSKVLKM